MPDISPTTKPILQEPTLHFFLIAVGIFLVYGIANRGDEQLLEIDQRDIDARIFMQEMTTGEALNAEQRDFITARYIEEQMLVNEALAMGLDNDARIHDMLAQKMLHVLSGDIIQPTEEELQTYYQENLERYRSMPALDTIELVFDDRGSLPDAVTSALVQNAAADTILALAEGSSDPLPNVNQLDLANIFEPEFAERVFAADRGEWVGPFVSNRGQHWLQVAQIYPARLPPLSEIRDRVRLEWINAEEEVRLQEKIAELWDAYSIVITESAGDDE